MHNDSIVKTVNDLIETCKDGEYGFQACAEHTRTTELRNLFKARALECVTVARSIPGFDNLLRRQSQARLPRGEAPGGVGRTCAGEDQ